MKPKPLLLPGALLGLLGLVLLLGTADTARAQTFNPTLEITLADPEAGANSDFTLDFNLTGPDCDLKASPAAVDCDVQFAAAVFFIPPEWGITPGDEIPIGAVVGSITATATLGVVNAACKDDIAVDFIMLNASIDPSDTVDYLDSDDEGFALDYFEDKDGSGLQDGIEKYPDFITRVLVDEADKPLLPIGRSAGITQVAGVDVLIQFLIFEPGTFIDENVPNAPELGYPSVTLLQNAGDPDQDPVPSLINDFCTPLTSSITTLGISEDNLCTDVPGAVLGVVATGTANSRCVRDLGLK